VQQDAGARADVDQVYRLAAAAAHGGQRQPQAGHPADHVGLHEPGADQRGQLVLVGPAEVDEHRPGVLRGPRRGAGQRRVVAAQRVRRARR